MTLSLCMAQDHGLFVMGMGMGMGMSRARLQVAIIPCICIRGGSGRVAPRTKMRPVAMMADC